MNLRFEISRVSNGYVIRQIDWRHRELEPTNIWVAKSPKDLSELVWQLTTEYEQGELGNVSSPQTEKPKA